MAKMDIKKFRELVRKMFKNTIDDVNIPPSQYPIMVTLAMKRRTSRQRFEIRKIAKEMLGVDDKTVSLTQKMYGAFTPMIQNSDGSLTPVDELGREIGKNDIIVIRRGKWDT